MAIFRKIIKGTPGQIRALPTLSPEQQQLLGSLVAQLTGPLSGGLQNLQQMLSGEAEAYEAPAMRQFQEQIVPSIAERFTGMGAGAQSSSAFGQQLGAAGAGLAENLAMQRAGLQERALSQLQGFLGQSMRSPYQYMQIPGTPSGLSQLFGGIGSGIGGGMGFLGMGGLLKLLGLGG